MLRARAAILVADNDPTVVEVASQILSRTGYRVLSAADGEAALRVRHEQAVDIFLIDALLPGISGADLVQRLDRPGRVVLMSNSAFDLVDRCLSGEFGAVGRWAEVAFIRKPFTEVALLNAVERALAADH